MMGCCPELTEGITLQSFWNWKHSGFWTHLAPRDSDRGSWTWTWISWVSEEGILVLCWESTTPRCSKHYSSRNGLLAMLTCDPHCTPVKWSGQIAIASFCKQGHWNPESEATSPRSLSWQVAEPRLKSNLLNKILTCGWGPGLNQAEMEKVTLCILASWEMPSLSFSLPLHVT